jgi:hypothetical protein
MVYNISLKDGAEVVSRHHKKMVNDSAKNGHLKQLFRPSRTPIMHSGVKNGLSIYDKIVSKHVVLRPRSIYTSDLYYDWPFATSRKGFDKKRTEMILAPRREKAA